MEKVINGFKNFCKKVYKNEYVRVFMAIFILGFIFFGTTALGNGLTMSFGGDYELQTLALYSDGYNKMWNFLRTGEFSMYDFSNAFGHDYMAGSAFYYSTSPLFYILLLCPQKYLFQGIYILMLIKYALGGLLFYVLLKKYFYYKDRTCFVGAIAYAFCGWNLYNLWFHFGDAMALFPLLMIGIERCLRKNKGGLLSISLILLAMANYFMFVPFAIFGVFYFIFRWIKIYGVTKKNGYTFWQRWNVAIKGALSYISGGLIAGIILIPNLMFSQQSGRVNYEAGLLQQFLSFFSTYEMVDGELVRTGFKSLGDIFNKDNLKALYEFMFKWPEYSVSWGAIDGKKIKLVIAANFLFMNSNCLHNTIFYTGGLDNMLGATFISTPLILLFVPTVINTFKSKNKWDIFTLIFCCIIPFIPFTYYLLHGFSKEYGRWELILVVMMLIYVLKTFDQLEIVNRWMFSVAIIFNVLVAGYCVYYSYTIGQIDMQYRILIILGELIFMFIVYHLTFVYHDRKWFKDLATGGIILELFVSTVITINMHGVTNYETLYDGIDVYTEERAVIEDIKEKDDSFYRIYNNKATRNYLNMPSALSYNGMSTFNTIYNGYNVPFITRSDLLHAGGLGDGALSMSYHEKRPYFDEFLGVKYYVVDKVNLNNDTSYGHEIYDGKRPYELIAQEYDANVPFGYKKIDTNYENFDVYENTELINLGFATKQYMIHSTAGMYKRPTYYETLYSNSVIIDEANEKIYGKDYEEKVLEKLMFFQEKRTNDNDSYISLLNSRLIKTVSMRNDFGENVNERETFVVQSQSSLLDTIQTQYGQYGNMMHGRWVEQGYYGDEITITSNYSIAKDATEENPANIILNLLMGPQCLVSLYGANDKLLTQDCHQYHHYGMSGAAENKIERSYYVTEEVKKIVIEFIGDAFLEHTYNGAYFNLDDLKIEYTYYNDFKEDWAYAKEHQLQNVENSINGFTFESNYESQHLVCLNVPYGEGWTLKMDDENVDMIVMNGGFIGFIAPSGLHSYTLDYKTPYLSTGLKITLGGLGLGLVTFIGYNYHYCLEVSKSIARSTILCKKKKEEDDNADTPTGGNDSSIELEDNNIANIEKEDKTSKTAQIIIKMIIALFGIIVGCLLASIFKNNVILGALGLVIGYCINSIVAYFASYFFKLTNLDKSSIIRYIKIGGVGLGIALLIYLLLALLKLHVIFNLLLCFILTAPILYLVYNKILKNKL